MQEHGTLKISVSIAVAGTGETVRRYTRTLATIHCTHEAAGALLEDFRERNFHIDGSAIQGVWQAEPHSIG
jgi:hypothetical protein